MHKTHRSFEFLPIGNLNVLKHFRLQEFFPFGFPIFKFDSDGFKVVFESDSINVTRNGKFVRDGHVTNGLFKLNLMNNINSSVYIVDSFDLWHNRLCHIDSQSMKCFINLGLIPSNIKSNDEKYSMCVK